MKVYDTRFFFEHYYSEDRKVLARTKHELRITKTKVISAITLHELYKLALEKEGEETAKLRTTLMKKDFKVMVVNPQIAELSAKLRHKYKIPMADSIIAATAQYVSAVCVTDDPHIVKVREVSTAWL